MKRIIIELTNKDIFWAKYKLLDPDYLADKVKNALSASEREKGEWTLVSSVEEMPKKALWVTHKGTDYAYVELIGWDSQRECRTEDGGFRCDNSRLKDVVAYLPYSRPEPYKSESEEV